MKCCPLHLIQLTPTVSSGVRGYCGETTTHWASLHLIFLCLNGWCVNRESRREFEKQEDKQWHRERVGRRKSVVWQIIVKALIAFIHPGRKSCLWTLLFRNNQTIFGCACRQWFSDLCRSLIICRLDRRERIYAGTLSHNSGIKNVWGSWKLCAYLWVFPLLLLVLLFENEVLVWKTVLCRCLTLGFSSLLSTICLSNSPPRCKEKWVGKGSEGNPADWKKKIVADFSIIRGALIKSQMCTENFIYQTTHLFSTLMAAY